MSFAVLLWECHVVGDTLGEEGLSTRLERHGAHEIVLLFKTDSDAFRRCFGRNEKGDVVSDGLFVFKKDKKSADEPLLIFVELKGKDVGHAFMQLESTVAAVKARLVPELKRVPDCKAVVITSSPLPWPTKKLKDGTPVQVISDVKRFDPNRLKGAARPEPVDLRAKLNLG